MHSSVDYNDHLVRESARFSGAIRRAGPDAAVPSCPDWNADDLLWHLGEVQYFWGTVVADGLDADAAGKLTPERPADRAALLEFYERASRRLAETLAAASPEARAWTWSQDQTVGFIQRRQAHEALIHRIDAELTAGDRTPVDPALAADGIDETLRVMYGGCPPWGEIIPVPGRTIRLRATDTGDSWLVTMARFTGTDPGSGASYEDEADIHIADTDTGEAALAEISGSAGDLDCWLWHRDPLGPVERSGEEEVLGEFEAAIEQGID